MTKRILVDGIELDKEVVGVYKLLNSLPGVFTISSCSGHGYSDCGIVFTCTNFDSLKRITYAVFSLRYKCGNDFDTKSHLWVLNFLPRQDYPNGLILSIDWQEDVMMRRLRKVNMKAWDILEDSLKEAKDKPLTAIRQIKDFYPQFVA